MKKEIKMDKYRKKIRKIKENKGYAIWSDAAFWLRMEKDGEGFRSRVLSGKVVARRHREMQEGV